MATVATHRPVTLDDLLAQPGVRQPNGPINLGRLLVNTESARVL